MLTRPRWEKEFSMQLHCAPAGTLTVAAWRMEASSPCLEGGASLPPMPIHSFLSDESKNSFRPRLLVLNCFAVCYLA